MIDWKGQDLQCGSHGLAILDVFSRPVSFRDAMRVLSRGANGIQDWQDLLQTVVALRVAGVLFDAAQTEPELLQAPKGFDKPWIHIKMLNDRPRTEGYLAAIRETVREGDVVLEIGTGTGVLAMAAAKAGARHVYAVEAGAIGGLAREVIAANELTDRITVIDGWSTRIDLPERADVMISEIIGDDPYAERILEATLDARKRLLKPSARQVPSLLEVWGLPIAVPADYVNRYCYTDDLRGRWASFYQMDFGPLVAASREDGYRFEIEPWIAREWAIFSEPVLLSRTDLMTFTDVSVLAERPFIVNRSGEINGLMVYFEAELRAGTTICTHPVRASDDSSWRNRVQILPVPLPVNAGDRLWMEYRYEFGATWCQITANIS